MTRVLALTNMYPPHHLGGYELSCYDVMTRLADRGHDVTVLTSDMRVDGVDDPPDEQASGVHRDLRLYWHEGNVIRPALRECLAIERTNQRALRHALDVAQPDVVSIWHMGAVSTGLLTTLIERQIPLVYSICDDWLSYAPRVDRWTWSLLPFGRAGAAVARRLGAPIGGQDLSRSGAFLFVSRFERDRSVRYTDWTFPRSDIVLSGIDRTLFRADDTAVRPWRGRLLFVGRLDERKGLGTLLDAMARLPSDVTLRVVGTGFAPDRERYEARAKALGIAARVSFEQLAREDVPAAYRDADACVFPSEWDEPFGLVPLEAMACATPVVTTRVGGGGVEFIRDRYNALVFARGDANALAKAVEQLASDAELRSTLVAGGLRTAAQLDVDRLADSFETWHEAAATGYAHGRPSRRTLELPAPMLDLHGPTVRVRVQDRQLPVVCRLDALPFRDATLSGLEAVDALELVPMPADGVREVARVLRRTGRCTIVAANRQDVRRLVRRRPRRPRAERWPCTHYLSGSHLHEFAWHQLADLFAAEFAVVEATPIADGGSLRARALRLALRLPVLRRFSSEIRIEGIA